MGRGWPYLRPACCIAIALALAAAGPTRAQSSAPEDQAAPAAPSPQAAIDLPLVEIPYNVDFGGRFPSMAQSLRLSADAYDLLHSGLKFVVDPDQAGWQGWLGLALLGGLDYVTLSVPPFMSWRHEEWHRAVLGQYGIDSHDDVDDLPMFATMASVSRVRDEDLAWLKRTHPADQVRLSTAGIEGEVELLAEMERRLFFGESNAPHFFLLPMLVASSVGYQVLCATSEAETMTDDMNRTEGADVPRRDFTGLDCTASVYDMFRPDEPYAARGVHPSGVGIDRYRKPSQLTGAERDYVRLQAWLSLLGALDPQLYGVRRFYWTLPGGSKWEWNAALRYLPSPFGSTLRLDGFLRAHGLSAFGSLQAYVSRDLVLPGVDATLRYSGSGVQGLRLSTRAALWLQPEALCFATSRVAPGGLFSLRLEWGALPRLAPYLEVESKTAGWVAGSVSLGADVLGRAGIVVYVF